MNAACCPASWHATSAGFRPDFRAGASSLGELIHVCGDGRIGNIQDFRRAAIIRLDLENFCAGITLGKFEDVREVRTTPGIDALRIIAYDRDVVMFCGQQINQIALELVRVLIFVHKNELKPSLILFAHHGIVLQKFQPQREQVVEIHSVCRALAGDVTLMLVGDLFNELGEITELAIHQILDGFMRVGRERENFVQHRWLGKMFILLVNLRVGHARLDQILRVVAVKNREIFSIADRIRVQA